MNSLARILLVLALAAPVAANAQFVRSPPPVVVPFPTVTVTVQFPPPTATTTTLPPLAATPTITIGGTAPAPAITVSGTIPAATAMTAAASTTPEMNAAADATADTNAAADATPATVIQTAPERAPAAVNVVPLREPPEAAEGDDGECDQPDGNASGNPDDCAGNGMRLDWWMIALILAIGALLLLWILKIRRR